MEWPTNLQLPSGQRQTTLVEQPKGKDLEYCIIAVNKAPSTRQAKAKHAIRLWLFYKQRGTGKPVPCDYI